VPCRSDVAVNYSAESPDEGALVTLGDDTKVQIHRRDSTGRARPSSAVPGFCTAMQATLLPVRSLRCHIVNAWHAQLRHSDRGTALDSKRSECKADGVLLQTSGTGASCGRAARRARTHAACAPRGMAAARCLRRHSSAARLASGTRARTRRAPSLLCSWTLWPRLLRIAEAATQLQRRIRQWYALYFASQPRGTAHRRVCASGVQMVAKQEAPDAVRCVKFSADPVDLLAYAEHERSVHVVDARKFSARQTLHAASASVGLSGLAFTPEVCALPSDVLARATLPPRLHAAARCPPRCSQTCVHASTDVVTVMCPLGNALRDH
jgi:Uncharacterised protein domain (DUF2415)